jgi:hypothetical protein
MKADYRSSGSMWSSALIHDAAWRVSRGLLTTPEDA